MHMSSSVSLPGLPSDNAKSCHGNDEHGRERTGLRHAYGDLGRS
jgi:hypothetical protein